MRQKASVVWVLTALLMARAGASGFDVKTLEQLGYNADIAEFFSKSRFLPGVHRVTLEVNAAQRYQEDVRFGQEGELCLDARLAETLRLQLTSPLADCERIESHWPQAQVRVFPGNFRVEITLPEEAFDPDKLRSELRGGYAVLLNYDLYGNRLQGNYGNQQTWQAMLEPSLNISNWVIRNRSNYSKSEFGSQLNVYETSATRDFPHWGALVQVGEFSAGGMLSGGLPITGVQLSSERFQSNHATLAVPLQGSVSSQATMEVKQRGQVMYRTLLPAGPFSLDSLGQSVTGVETEVTVTDAEGVQQRFNVTPSLGDESGQQGGYQLAMGRYRTYGGQQDRGSPPALLMGEKRFSVSNTRQFGIGGMLSTKYQRLAWQGSLGDGLGNWLSGNAVYSQGRRQGGQLNIQGQLAASSSFSLSLTSGYQTLGFREADESLRQTGPQAEQNAGSRLHYTGGVALSWNTQAWGGVSYSLSHERYYHDSTPGWMHSLAYSKRLGSATLSLSVQSSSRERPALYAGISLPLGSGSVNSRLQLRRNNQMTLGNSWQGVIGGGRLHGYLDLGRDSNGEYQTSGNLSGNTAYTRLSLGASRSSQGRASQSLVTSGSMGVANNIWVMSPQRAGDTLVVVSVPGQSGARVMGAGDGITDFAGDVLLPSATPYMPLKAQIDTLSLPLNLRLDSTAMELELARGSVATRQFRITEVRQLLLTLRDAQGDILSTGASVHDEKGQLLGTLIGEGNLMLVNEDIGKALRVRRVNMNECQVSYDVPAEFDPSVLYEERDAVCN
ncbi:fimbria/pilus outer membrane usher protein [Serratia fonticola]|uniref:fimbria/pilus outer membrane usher protein n=1 Tax=Serratia fonticola TaxID=47917 RepID=UPI002DBD8E6B|nr:fimbria/pilus outer membrane usher protein [Serratia fonticola]MEB7883688.1 fimbria/pilus outer membrane usher protein [Serratia fonticola]